MSEDVRARKEIDRLIAELDAAAQRGHASLITPKLRHFMNTQVSELTAANQRAEALQAKVDAVSALVAKTLEDPDIKAELGDGETCTCHRCQIMREVRDAMDTELASALSQTREG